MQANPTRIRQPSLKGLGKQLVHAETTIGCGHSKLALEGGDHLQVHWLIGGLAGRLPLLFVPMRCGARSTCLVASTPRRKWRLGSAGNASLICHSPVKFEFRCS